MDTIEVVDDEELRWRVGGDAFTVEILEEIFTRPRAHPGYVLTERYNPPTREALKKLADHLNAMTVAVHATRWVKAQIDSEMDLVKKAVLITDYLLPYAQARSIDPRDLDMRDFEAVFKPDRWENVALSIARSFELAMCNWRGVIWETDLEPHFGYSGGAVPRFVCAVVPLVTGEKPTLAAVMQKFKRAGRAK